MSDFVQIPFLNKSQGVFTQDLRKEINWEEITIHNGITKFHIKKFTILSHTE